MGRPRGLYSIKKVPTEATGNWGVMKVKKKRLCIKENVMQPVL